MNLVDNELVPKKIIVHPFIRTPPLRTPHNPTIKPARSSKVIDRNGEMEWAELGHGNLIKPLPSKGGVGVGAIG